MGIYAATKVGRGEDQAESRPPTVAEIEGEDYNAAMVDDAGNEFPASFLASSAGAVAAAQAFTGESASGADSLAIPITAPLCKKTTGGDAEALTIIAGVFIGQRITIVLAVDGNGVGTLVPALSTMFATIVFADAGDQATLEWVGGTTGWIIVGTSDLAGTGGPVWTQAS
jgi:hypothetical protein